MVPTSDCPALENMCVVVQQIGVNGASYVHSGSSHCLVGPGCGRDSRESEQSGSPDPTPRGGRRLSEVTDAVVFTLHTFNAHVSLTLVCECKQGASIGPHDRVQILMQE